MSDRQDTQEIQATQATAPPADMRRRQSDVEPRPEAGAEPRSDAAPPAPAQTQPVHQTELWPDMSEFRQRFHEIEAEFVHEPRAAVKKAENLIDEAVERMTRGLHEQRQRIRGDMEKNHDTEQLRIAMLTYREFIDSMGGRRVA